MLFDSVAVLPSAEGCGLLVAQAAAVNFVRDAYAHLKVIAYSADAAPLFEAAGVPTEDGDAGLVDVARSADVATYLDAAAAGRIWDREEKVRDVP